MTLPTPAHPANASERPAVSQSGHPASSPSSGDLPVRSPEGGIISLEQNTDEWMTWRAGGFGASDIWLAYTEPFALYINKREGIPLYADGDLDAAALQWGHDVEKAILTHVARANRWGLLPPAVMQHPAKPWWGASLDGAVANIGEGFCRLHWPTHRSFYHQVNLGPIDAKNRAFGWDDFDLTADVAEAGTCPPKLRVQAMAQTYVMRACGFDVDRAWLAICLAGRPPVALEVPYDAELFEGSIVPAVDELWQRILDGNAPEITGGRIEHSVVKRAHRIDEGEVVDLGERGARLLADLEFERGAIKEREQEKRRIESELRSQMNGHAIALCGDREYVRHDKTRRYTTRKRRERT